MSSAFAAPRGAGPQQSALLWLAVRMSLNVRGAAAAGLLRLSAGTALAAMPLTIWLAASLPGARPGALTWASAFSLALASCPGAAVSLWAAHAVAADRAAVTEALRQVGAERVVSWVLPAVRVGLATVVGSLAGIVGLFVLHETLFRDLAKSSPLHVALTASSTGGWALAAILVTVLLTACALFASGAGHRAAGRLRDWLHARAEARNAPALPVMAAPPAPPAALVTGKSRNRPRTRRAGSPPR